MINILDKLFTNSKYLFQPLTSPERITTSNSFWQHLQNNCSIFGVPLTAKRCYLYWKLFCGMSFFINYATISSLSAYIYVRIQQLWSCFDFGSKWVWSEILKYYSNCYIIKYAIQELLRWNKRIIKFHSAMKKWR